MSGATRRNRDLSAAAYARAIERRWSELAGRPVVLSPRDWSRVSDWHARRIPLEIVHEAMEEAARRSRGGTPLRTLAAVGRAVLEAWEVVRQGRIAEPPSDGSAGTAAPRSPRELWGDRLAAEAPDSALGSLLRGLLERLDRGEDPAALDEELDRNLPEAAPERLLQAVRDEIEREMEGYRSRMPADRFAATRRRGRVERLRRRLVLPRLSGP